MTWRQQLESITDAAVDTAAFGEPITLADTTQITALFNLNNPEGWGLGGPVQEMLDAQPQPYLQLTEATAAEHSAALAPRMLITARGVGYLIAEPGEPDGHGLIRYPLMPRQPQDDDPTAGAQRWR